MVQSASAETNSTLCRYWTWRFDRLDGLVGQEDSWGKSLSQAVADLEAASLIDATLGSISGVVDVELVIDTYFPNTAPTLMPPSKTA